MIMVPSLTALPDISPATTIATIHARYEAAWSEEHRLEVAMNAIEGGGYDEDMLSHSYGEGRKKLCRETNALQQAILYQVPGTWRDAIILQFHIWDISNRLSSCGKRHSSDECALSVGIDTLFDFLAAETSVDHGEVGPMFKDGVMLVWNRRRQRTADLED